MDLKEKAQALVDIFAPDPESYGTYPSTLTPSVDKPGKLDNPQKGVTFAQPWGLAQIENHITGIGVRFGVVPINVEGTVKFMACDIDVYGSVDLPKMAKKLFDIHPMLFVLRSKSGGPHVYAFFREPVRPGEIREKMREIIATLAIAGMHEYFPKQNKVDVANKEFANWINMPYYNAEGPSLQYGFHPETGEALPLEDFIAHVQGRAGTLQDFLGIKLAGSDLITDGPACMQRIFGEKAFVNRNTILSNLIVYLKRKWPESWHLELEKYNDMFDEPLTASELAAMIKSYGKREYSYACTAEPLASYCNRASCNLRKYGISSGHAFPFIVSLTKHNSDPPIWWVYFDNNQKMRCTTEELQNSKAFQAVAMEQMNSVPPILKQDTWTKMLQEMMKSVTIVEVPENASQFGLMRQYILDYLTHNGAGETMEELLAHKPVVVDGDYYFQLSELMAWLSKKSFGLAKADFITMVLGQMGAKFGSRKVSAKTTRHLYWLPVGVVESGHEELPVPQMQDTVAY